MRKLSVVKKLLIIVGLGYLTLLVTLLSFQLDSMSTAARERFDSEMDIYSNLLTTAAQDAIVIGDLTTLESAAKSILARSEVDSIELKSLDNETVFVLPKTIQYELPVKVFDVYPSQITTLNSTLDIENEETPQEKLGTLIIRYDDQPLQSQLSNILGDMLLFLSAGILGMIIIQWFISKAIVKPITFMVSRLTKIGTEEYEPLKVYERRSDELGLIAKFINEAHSRIIESQNDQTRLNKKLIKNSLKAKRDTLERDDAINNVIETMLPAIEEGIDAIQENSKSPWHKKIIQTVLSDLQNRLVLLRTTAQNQSLADSGQTKCLSLKEFFDKWVTYLNEETLEGKDKELRIFAHYDSACDGVYGIVHEVAVEFCYWSAMDSLLRWATTSKHEDICVSVALTRTSNEISSLNLTISGKYSNDNADNIANVRKFFDGSVSKDSISSEPTRLAMYAVQEYISASNGSLTIRQTKNKEVIMALTIPLICSEDKETLNTRLLSDTYTMGREKRKFVGAKKTNVFELKMPGETE